MQAQPLLDLAVSWTRVGMFSFGAGPGMIPLMKTEVVDLRHWMTEEQFLQALAVANAMPGPIASKMSMHVGRVVAGAPGVLVAFTACTVPAGFLMLGFAGAALRWQKLPMVGGALTGLAAAVLGVIAWSVIDLAADGIRSWGTALVAVGAMAALALRVHPLIVLGAAALVGAWAFR